MFSERLKELRKEKGLTQKELANLSNTTQQNIAFYEKGTRKPKIETTEQLAKALETSTDYLLGKTDNPQSSLEIDIAQALEKSVAYDGKPITDNDKQIITDFLKEYFANKQ